MTVMQDKNYLRLCTRLCALQTGNPVQGKQELLEKLEDKIVGVTEAEDLLCGGGMDGCTGRNRNEDQTVLSLCKKMALTVLTCMKKMEK